MHLKNYIHRDIKPENFAIGLDKESNSAYILDFGLAKKFRDTKTHQHIPYKENKSLTGTARYASINTHLGIEQSRRDDLEALGNVLIYLSKGKLPWQGVHAKTKEKKHERILSKKMGTPIEYLCDRMLRILIPPSSSVAEFAMYMHYCRALKFEDRPDYVFLKKLFTERMEKEHMEFDLLYDWVELEGKKPELVSTGTNKSLGGGRSMRGTKEDYKREPSQFRTAEGAIQEEAENKEESKRETPEGGEEEKKEGEAEAEAQEEQKEEPEDADEQFKKEDRKKRVEDVLKQIQEMGKENSSTNEKAGPSIKDVFSSMSMHSEKNV